MPGILTKNDYAYTELRSRILSGDLPAGGVIPQGELAQQLGLSTTPLREAIRRLTAEGLVELSAHRDARVARLSAEEARQLHEVRERIDPFAAALAAEHRKPHDLAEMEDALGRLVPIRADTSVDALLKHRDFHRAVYQASGNEVLVDILERLWDKADRYRLLGVRATSPGERTDADVARVDAEHRAIFAAVAAGDPVEAELVTRMHIRGSLVRRAISALEGTAD
ncbi:GntR family transcriptional regulator [Promicromonospora sukumoe]|uniref:GntR family transcriptional regulator n=1 Tax=Promicromonospora sukumoe TaxID=88382 RepID=UPI0037CA2E70